MRKSTTNQILLILVVILTASLVFVIFHSSVTPQAKESGPSDVGHHSLLQLIRLQNETISLMEKELVKQAKLAASGIQASAMDFIHKRQEESAHVVKVMEETHAHHDTSVDFRKWPVSDMENDCEERFGLSLVGKWQENRQVWCQDNSASKNSQPSELVCYRYHQHHKKREGQGPDMFCVATNFVIDFSKV